MSDFLRMVDAGTLDLLLGITVIVSFGLLILVVLFGLLAVRGVWRFLTRRTWGDVIVSSQRKALR